MSGPRTAPLVLLLACAAPLFGQPVTRCGADRVPAPGGRDFAEALAGGVVFFACGNETRINFTGTHLIAGDVLIDGDGVMTLSGQDLHLLFRLAPGARLTLRGLTITGGAGVVESHGGGHVLLENGELRGNVGPIRMMGGTLAVRDMFVSDNVQTAIVTSGTRVEIERSHFRANRGFFGGALHSTAGTVVIRDRTDFFENQATYGGAISAWGPLEIDGTVFTGNRAMSGGALHLMPSASLEVADCRFEANQASRDGGAVWRTVGTVGTSPPLRLSNSQFMKNTALDGGAIALAPGQAQNRGTIGLLRVTFSENAAARNGGAIAAGGMRLEVVRNVFVRNQAEGAGGAVYLQLGDLGAQNSTIANSLLVANRANGVEQGRAGGGIGIYPPIRAIGGQGTGGGARVAVVNSTIADNEGGGIMVSAQPFESTGVDVRLSNTIVSTNTPRNCPGGAFSDDGHNLQFGDASCSLSIPVAPPLFDRHYAPAGFSPARRAGNDAVCGAPPIHGVDILAHRRSQDGPCTIGAVERKPDPPVRRDRERRHRAPRRERESLTERRP